jgi:hypothetical protein
VPLADLQVAGERIVDHLLANGPEAIAQTKACALRLSWSNLEDDAFAGLIESHAAKRQSGEAAEGFASFLEASGALESGPETKGLRPRPDHVCFTPESGHSSASQRCPGAWRAHAVSLARRTTTCRVACRHLRAAAGIRSFPKLRRRLIVRHDLCAEALEPAGIRS